MPQSALDRHAVAAAPWAEAPSRAGDAQQVAPPLACPRCDAALDWADDASAVSCPTGHRWPVAGGIPRFVAADGYARAFGLQWLTFRRTQLDSHSGTTISRDRAHRCLGATLLADLAAGRAASVLEVGCGAGRFTEILLEAGAAVTSVDLSAAVEANAENCPPSARHRVLQADVEALPFAPRQYDVVFCLGVIQHTPSPETTIARLYDQVRPGGVLVIDHYAKDPGWWLSAKPLWRAVLKRLPPDVSLRWTNRLVSVFLPLHARIQARGPLQSLLARVSPVMCYYSVLPLTDEGHREWALLDTHDSLTDWYKHRRTPAQLRAAVERLGADVERCEPGGIGVELRARRPLA